MLEKISGQNPVDLRLDSFQPGISVDCVILGYREGTLTVLLLKWKNTETWSLPGGFLKKDETLEQAATRVLMERTGLNEIFLEQFHTFSGLDRNWDSNPKNLKSLNTIIKSITTKDQSKVKHWFSKRFISIGYFSLVDTNKVTPTLDYFSEKCSWIRVDQLPDLVLDHEQIIVRALEHLKIKINYLPIGMTLLPKKFTMTQLRSLYETILKKSLDRGNFQRKILKLNVLTRHEKLMTGAQNKAPYLYSFDVEVYNRLVKEGIGFSI